MNRSKAPLFNKLKKTMTKEIKKGRVLSREAMKDEEELTLKELRERFPKSLHAKKLAIKKEIRLSKSHKVSKRTTPGTIDQESPPASCHREGIRWMKNTRKQISTQRKEMAHRGGRKK